MSDGPLPVVEEFARQVRKLIDTPEIAAHAKGDRVDLSKMSLNDIALLLSTDVGLYLLMAASGMNRTTLRSALSDPEVSVVRREYRRAQTVRARLPLDLSFEAVAERAVQMRRGDLARRERGQFEQLFRERLQDEGIPLFMSPPRRIVPGVVIPSRKPDGVWPDPAQGLPPRLYLEIKNVRRPADDIQKRLYELVEASLEMKLLYSGVQLSGLGLTSTTEVSSEAALRLRSQIIDSPPVIDRLFFQEEIEDCLDFLKEKIQVEIEEGL